MVLFGVLSLLHEQLSGVTLNLSALPRNYSIEVFVEWGAVENGGGLYKTHHQEVETEKSFSGFVGVGKESKVEK